jgi:hypothetical protein
MDKNKKIQLFATDPKTGKQIPDERTFEEWVPVLMIELRLAIDRLTEAVKESK